MEGIVEGMIHILDEIKDAKRIGITGHVRPDGDCLGSTLALWHFIKNARPDALVKVYLEKPAACFDCLPGITEIDSEFQETEPFDVFFVLDSVAEPDRIGGSYPMFEKAAKTINIDHHISNVNGSGDLNYVVPDASSASEVMYDLIGKENIDEDIAVCLYIGITHDTGILQFSNTAPKTLRIIADLVEFGFDFPALIDLTYHQKTYAQNQILGRALLESILFMDGQCIVSYIDKKTMDFFGCTEKDMDGVVNQLRITTGVEVAIFVYECGSNEKKVSLRSNGKIDVAKVATFFGGGGHVRASGCTMKGTYHDVINNISAEIEKQMKS